MGEGQGNSTGGKAGSASKPNPTRRKTRANSLGVQWWRKLMLPRRGKKDSKLFPGVLTLPQKQRTEHRRTALFKAIASPRVSREKHLARAEWISERGLACVTCTRGNAMQSMGFFEQGKQYLFPEEALWLADRGGIDFCINGLPASMQRAWSVAISAPNCISMKEYLVYAYLRRAGYVVRRYEGEEGDKGLKISFSVWRVGGYKRKDEAKPLFYLAVFSYEDFTPGVGDIATWIHGLNDTKTRLRFAIIDRGVVTLTDVAMNATPLSDRFINRLSLQQKEVAKQLENGDISSYFNFGENVNKDEDNLNTTENGNKSEES